MNGRIQSALPGLAALLIGSTVLGYVYNTASPLGVRPVVAVKVNSAATTAAPAAPSPAPVANAPATGQSRIGYANRTVSMSLETLGTPALRTTTPAPGNVTSLTWPQVKALLADGRTLLVDARPLSNFQTEHIPGAVSLPATSTTAELTAFVAQHGKDRAYVIYCGSGQCGLSKAVADALIKAGCSNVKTMPGGYAEYRLAEPK